MSVFELFAGQMEMVSEIMHSAALTIC